MPSAGHLSINVAENERKPYVDTMANIKTRYVQLTKQLKKKQPLKGQPQSQAAKEEAELALKIRRRARADYRTVAKAS